MNSGKDCIQNKGNISVLPLDLMDFSSIKSFTEKFQQKYKRLDVLLNNAGIMTTPYFLTIDGLEAQMGTNHFGHFALTGLLFSLLKNTPASRIVNVSSMAHKQGKMDFSNLLFTYELQRRMEASGIKGIAVASHPGVSSTNLFQYLEEKMIFKIFKPLISPFIQEQEMGALPQIRASVDEHVKGGEFYGPDGFNEMKGFPVFVQSNAASHNLEDARKLWEVSEKITGISYQF
jgi:NAD(P)-dependent dehydrogenase (short-subunit alcohol dehydrogenase family)